MARDEDQLAKLKRDAVNAPAFVCEIVIRVNYDGTMGITGPMGDKELFLQALEQAIEAVKANAKSRNALLIPAAYGDAKARPEGYF